MNWIEEVRRELDGLNQSTVEMSEAVIVRLGPVALWLHSDRSVTLECRGTGLLTRATRSVVELIEDRMAARGWRLA